MYMHTFRCSAALAHLSLRAGQLLVCKQAWHTPQAEHPVYIQDSLAPAPGLSSRPLSDLLHATADESCVKPVPALIMVAVPPVLDHRALSSPATKALAIQGSSNSKTDQAPIAGLSCRARVQLVDTGRDLATPQ